MEKFENFLERGHPVYTSTPSTSCPQKWNPGYAPARPTCIQSHP